MTQNVATSRHYSQVHSSNVPPAPLYSSVDIMRCRNWFYYYYYHLTNNHNIRARTRCTVILYDL